MTTLNRVELALMLVLTTGLIGCSSGFTSEHDPSVTVDSLTDEEAADLCVALFDHYAAVHGENATVRVVCRSTSLGATDEAACGDTFDGCVASTELDVRARCEQNITDAREGCTATVAEIEACADATATLYGDVLARTCAEAPVEDAIGLTSSPEECASLPGTCNSFVLQSGR